LKKIRYYLFINLNSHMPPETYRLKKELRKTMLARRTALPLAEWEHHSEQIGRTLQPLITTAKPTVIHTYVSMAEKREVQTTTLIENFLKSEFDVVVPVVTKNGLVSAALRSMQDLQQNAWGILEPDPIMLVRDADISLVLVPCLAVDRQGNRLGYGKGYYDKFFNRLAAANIFPLKVALAFSFQVLNNVPSIEADVPLDYIATEAQLIKTKL
jgi:5-formyltetrahydrofolate cyclo-ligase